MCSCDRERERERERERTMKTHNTQCLPPDEKMCALKFNTLEAAHVVVNIEKIIMKKHSINGSILMLKNTSFPKGLNVL